MTNVDWLYDELMEKWEDATPDKKARVARVEDELITEYFAGLTDVELRQCRNWPYALHGYSFKDDALCKALLHTLRLLWDDPRRHLHR